MKKVLILFWTGLMLAACTNTSEYISGEELLDMLNEKQVSLLVYNNDSLSEYNQYVTAINKIFDYLSKMKAGWNSLDNNNYIENNNSANRGISIRLNFKNKIFPILYYYRYNVIIYVAHYKGRMIF